MNKITLYHGTDIETAKKIAKKGLYPRGNKRKNVWEHLDTSVASGQDRVYLTNKFAIRFAITKSEHFKVFSSEVFKTSTEEELITKNDDAKIAVIEIECADTNLYPDEDFLGQIPRQFYSELGINHDYQNMGILEKTKIFRDNINDYKSYWKESLRLLGTCAYKGRVKPKQIKQIKIISLSTLQWYRNYTAEINFGYNTAHGRFHELELKKVMGYKLSDSEEETLETEGKQVSQLNWLKDKRDIVGCFYETTGNPNVDDRCWYEEDGLHFPTILTDQIKKQFGYLPQNVKIDMEEK